MKKNWLTLLLSLSLILLSVSVSLADPSQLLIARTAAGALWTKTCTGTTCSEWGPISGVLAMDPTLIWDQSTAKYYLYGIVSSGQVWRSTFNADGTFNDDWVWSGGASSSPIIAAAGGRWNNFNASGQTSEAITLSGTSVTNVKSIHLYAPGFGFFLCTASGDVEHYRASTSGYTFANLYLTATSGGTATTHQASELPPGSPAGYTHFPYAFQRWFTASAAGDHTYYLTAEAGLATGSIIQVNDTMVSCQYFPYSY